MPPIPDKAEEVPSVEERKPRNPLWLADQHRKQDDRRCYVCGGRDDGGCHGIDGEMYECPWY
jgi:hypothetical protein